MLPDGDGGSGRDERAVSNVLGYMLVFAIVIGGVTTVVVVGGSTLTDAQSQSELQRAEHSMTLFDSRAAMVALGDANTQSISFGQDSGSFRAEPEQGWLRITHTNHSKDPAARTEVIYNESLGALIYENGDRTLAYQGGGVWQRDTQGKARMVSPPEFHYRGATLTLPIIRTQGTAAGGGSVDVSVRPLTQAEKVFPKKSPPTGTDEVGVPYNVTNRNYTNPVRNGSVNVTVRSAYYEGWAYYFEERTTGEVTVWDTNNTVRLQLKTVGGPPGNFEIPDEGESVQAGGIGDGHPLENFEFDITYTSGSNDYFSLYDEDNNEQFELNIFPTGNNYQSACPTEPDSNVYVGVYYYSGDGSEKFDYWETTIDPDAHPDDEIDWSCNANDEPVLHIDLLNDFGGMDHSISETPGISCGNSGNKWRFNEQINECDDFALGDTTLEGHDDVSWESGGDGPYSPGTDDTDRTVNDIVNHYMSLMGPDMDLTTNMGPGGSRAIDTSESSGELTYETRSGAQYITYLHVTENEIEVDVD